MMDPKPFSKGPTLAGRGTISALNALDLALESQKMEAETEDFVVNLLPLFDAIERLCRGLERESPESLVEKAEALSLLPEMVDEATARLELVRTGRAGEPVDRLLHEVVDVVPAAGRARGTILEVLQDGWVFRGRILRRAKVVVSVEERSDEPACKEINSSIEGGPS